MGDLLGFWKGRLVNFAVRHVRKMVPEFQLAARRWAHGHSLQRRVLDWHRRLSLRRHDLVPDDVAFLQYTGGTTGVSKGATLLHRNVVANILQTEAWFKPMLDKLGDQADDDCLCAAAVSHLCVDDLLPDGRALGRHEPADPQPARHAAAS